MKDYELCIIGAGTAGFAAAEVARKLGKRVLLVSGPGDLGGLCILRGCMPAKTLLSAAQRLGEVESAAELGVRAEAPSADLPAIVKRKRELVDYFAEDRVAELEDYPLLRGSARFVARDTVEVEGRRLSAERFIIATGSAVVAPPIPGLAACGYFTSDGALEMTRAPASLAILGGGPVGCEFAQYFARLGTRVVLMQDGPTLLRKEDEDIGRAIGAALEDEGIELIPDATLLRCERADGDCTVTYERAGSTHRLCVEKIMLASHRVPSVAGLQLEVAGVQTDAGGGVRVDAYLRTTNEAVFAAGDVLGRRFLVHVAAYAGARAASNAFSVEPMAADFDRYEVHAVYTQPQVAVAGLTERECRARGIDVRVRRHPFRDVGKALVSAHVEGFVKMLAGPDDRILGIAIVGDDAIDLIGEAVALIDARATTQAVADMPHLHPTMGEILARVAEDFADADPSRSGERAGEFERRRDAVRGVAETAQMEIDIS